jgi:CheY-like chemotaxis protein
MTAQSISVHVLVIDDDAMSRELLCVLLEAEGYVAEPVDSGDAALALLSRGEPAPDLVLVDMQMPGTNGAQLAGKLRRACGKRALLLAMSGSRPADKAISRFDGFLLKPFRMEEIAAILSARGQREAGAKTSPRRERRIVVHGPASAASPTKKLMSIQAPMAHTASNGRMNSQVTAAEPDRAPVLNDKIYQQLAGSMPAEQLRQLYSMCVNDARARIATMRRLANMRDGEKFVREAHAIKGGCGMLGATELHGMAAALETSGLDTTAPGAPEVNSLDELAAACDRLERMLGSRV